MIDLYRNSSSQNGINLNYTFKGHYQIKISDKNKYPNQAL